MRGEVLVRLHSDNPSRFKPASELMVGADPDSAASFKVAASRPHQGAQIVKFNSVETRNDAERLRGELIFVSASELEGLEEDSFWEHELIGLEVVDSSGRRLGQLQEILSRPDQDLWKVDTDTGSVLLPAVKELVRSVDLEAGTITADPPEGLFEEP
jgi:16S rRNA processing protein RimM